jgi:hypothetical protein
MEEKPTPFSIIFARWQSDIRDYSTDPAKMQVGPAVCLFAAGIFSGKGL